jgi:hypothetical protein
MSKPLSDGAWGYTDLQERYEKAQLLAATAIQDFAGNYFFPSDRSTSGFWTTTRRQAFDYVCDCPDFNNISEAKLISTAPSRWVRADWSSNPNNTKLVNRCIHCFAIAIENQELDPNLPINRIYKAKRERYPKTDCGCPCGDSNDELGLPKPKLILGCETDCYVEPLTPRTQRTPSTNEGIPAFQTFEISRIQFAQTRYQACAGGEVTLTLERSTSMGFNNATVVGLATDVEFSFEPEFRTSSREVSLENFSEGIYAIAISSIASGNFGDNLEAEIELVDCGDRNDDGEFDDLPPCEERFFEDGDGSRCEGQYYVSFHQTGKTLPDGSCEILKVLQFDAALDCPFPEDPPPKECSSTKQRDCSPLPLDLPTCVDTGSGDGFNSNAGFNAIVKKRTGLKTIEYLRPDKKECAEVCEFVEEAIYVPSCEEPPRKPAPPPFPPGCSPPSPECRWSPEMIPPVGYGSHGSVLLSSGLELYLHCEFSTTPPPDLGCDFNRKWKCVDGACVQDANGAYATQAECQAACALPAPKWKCVDGVCVQDANGVYASQSACQAALNYAWTATTIAGYSAQPPGFCHTPSRANVILASGNISAAQFPVSAVIDNRIPQGCPGTNHYKIVDALGIELVYLAESSDGYTINHIPQCPP